MAAEKSSGRRVGRTPDSGLRQVSIIRLRLPEGIQPEQAGRIENLQPTPTDSSRRLSIHARQWIAEARERVRPR
jgi:hypothetical protein